MSKTYVVSILFTLCVCKGESLESRSSINADSLSNGTNSNETISGRQAGYGLVRFDGPVDQDKDQHGHHVTFAEDGYNNRPLKFEDEIGPSNAEIQTNNVVNPSAIGNGGQNSISFQDDTSQNQGYGHKKRRRRRRKKSRRQNNDYDMVGPITDIPPRHQLMAETYGFYQPGGQPPPGSQSPLRSQPPLQGGRPQVHESARPLQAISEALSSILENDTKHCVKRSLCEQAATSDQINKSSLMRTVFGIFQYLPLLKRSPAINAFPLFKSVGDLMLAMRHGSISRNESICAQKYPDCPSDLEERIHYMNNHNGGLFRFFGGKDHQQYTAQEFHNHLLSLGLKPQYHPNANQYGVYQPFPVLGPNGEKLAYPFPGKYDMVGNPYPYTGQYGVYNPNKYQQNLPPNRNGQHYSQAPANNNNGLSQPHRPVYPNQAGHIYGAAYPHYRRFNFKQNFKSDAKESEDSINEIQKRIQNHPGVFFENIYDNGHASSMWSFPKLESTDLNVQSGSNKIRDGRELKFPNKDVREEYYNEEDKQAKRLKFPDKDVREEYNEEDKEAKGFKFPGTQSNRQYLEFLNDYSANNDLMFDSISYDDGNANDDDGVEIVYVVRGNGDPARPEIIKLRPGEEIH